MFSLLFPLFCSSAIICIAFLLSVKIVRCSVSIVEVFRACRMARSSAKVDDGWQSKQTYLFPLWLSRFVRKAATMYFSFLELVSVHTKACCLFVMCVCFLCSVLLSR